MITDSPKQTQKIAELLVKTLIKTQNHPTIFCLQGNLGAGKTTFIQGIAKALKIKEKITSPTFVLMKKFHINDKLPFSKLFHFDCYRFDKPKGILVLGFKEIIKNPKNLVFISAGHNSQSLLQLEILVSWLHLSLISHILFPQQFCIIALIHSPLEFFASKVHSFLSSQGLASFSFKELILLELSHAEIIIKTAITKISKIDFIN